ncbi:MAG: XTP/dITP diphosphatase [Chloroflexi bacterium]|nr:MAG: XTP/dITP diphosphatase [Chloroflexota bacterium]
MRRLLIATHNKHKLREFRDVFAALPLELVSLDDAEVRVVVDETGQTFKENAVLKARGYSAASGLLTLADDSGIEVDALQGAPGVMSSRFAGPAATADERNRLLLERLQGVLPERRRARYRCVIAIAQPAGDVKTVEGTCEGQIALAPRGSGGFGYDPIFYVPEFGRTMAELPAEQKHRLSHRGIAARKAAMVLWKIVG